MTGQPVIHSFSGSSSDKPLPWIDPAFRTADMLKPSYTITHNHEKNCIFPGIFININDPCPPKGCQGNGLDQSIIGRFFIATGPPKPLELRPEQESSEDDFSGSLVNSGLSRDILPEHGLVIER